MASHTGATDIPFTFYKSFTKIHKYSTEISRIFGAAAPLIISRPFPALDGTHRSAGNEEAAEVAAGLAHNVLLEVAGKEAFVRGLDLRNLRVGPRAQDLDEHFLVRADALYTTLMVRDDRGHTEKEKAEAEKGTVLR